MSAIKKLRPADPKQCQAEWKTGSFMTLGPREWERCTSAPIAIIVEIKPGKDRLRGSMSVCADCLAIFKKKTKDWEDNIAIVEIKQ